MNEEDPPDWWQQQQLLEEQQYKEEYEQWLDKVENKMGEPDYFRTIDPIIISLLRRT
jgi:hypothetical protein